MMCGMSDGVNPPSHRGAAADSLSRLLAQAVQSGDKSLLEEPLNVRREAIIRQTLQKLPVGLVVPLMKQVIRLAPPTSRHSLLLLCSWFDCWRQLQAGPSS